MLHPILLVKTTPGTVGQTSNQGPWEDLDVPSVELRQEVASMDISLHETAVAQETVYEAGGVS